jgi:subtilisin family serine protease
VPSALAGGEQPAEGAPRTPAAELSDDRLIVQWAARADSGDRLAAREDADVSFERTLGDRDFHLVEVDPGQSASAAIAELKRDSAVLVAERDGWSTPHGVPNDPLFGDLWGLRNLGGTLGVGGFAGPLAGADIDALGAWVRTTGTPSTVVAVLDTGYRFSHPDLASVAWTNSDETDGDGDDDDGNGFVDDRRGYDFVGASSDAPTSDKDPNDDNLLSGGHGVHVSGTIGAAGGNGVGITGVAQNVRLMPLRVCAHSATAGGARCPFSSQIAAINYAGANGARVANMSLGGTTFTQTIVNAIAANPQTLFVISAGNDGQNNEVTHHYPCDYRPTVDASPPVAGAIDNIVCVAATNQADGLAGFSDYGATSVDLGAPGTEVLSAYPTSPRYQESFGADDFAGKWSATGLNGGFGRTNESPQTSFGISDSPGAAPTASSVRESTSITGVAIPAGTGSCVFSGRRYLSRGGGTFTYSVLSNDVPVFTSTPASDTGGSAMVSFFTVPISGLGGTAVKLRFRYTAGISPMVGNGIWLDDLKIACYDSATSTAATFGYLEGTSMAAPHVAGAAGLLFSYKPSGTVTEIRNALLAAVDPVPALAGKVVTGGRLNVSRAVDSFDFTAPAAPQLSSTSPASPANLNSPLLRGAAEERSTVSVYAGAACSGAPVATGSADQLAGGGIAVTVPDNATSTFTARATDTASNVSSCSAPISYVENSPLPPGDVARQIVTGDGGVSAAKCKVPKLKKLSLSKAKALLGVSNCKLGKVTKPKKKGQKKLPALVVKSSSPKAGAELTAGAKVAVTLGPKPKPKKRKKR